LEAGREEALKHVDEVTYRIYRAYLASGALGFRSAWYNLHQTLLVKAGDRARPGTSRSSPAPATSAAGFKAGDFQSVPSV
jgi:hypothetical protein